MASVSGSTMGFESIPLNNISKGSKRRMLPPSAYFNDGKRVIDFILSFQPDAGGKKKQENGQIRRTFENALKIRGLELEYEGKEQSQDGKTAYVKVTDDIFKKQLPILRRYTLIRKVHATWEALCRQAELEDIQMPIMESDLEPRPPSLIRRLLDRMGNPCALQEEYQIEVPECFTDAFTRERASEFLIEDKETFFSEAQRVALTWGVISGVSISWESKKKKKKNGNNNSKAEQGNKATKTANIFVLLRGSFYAEAYPIHDGDCGDDEENDLTNVPIRQWPLRKYLYETWARPKQWLKYQPLDHIRNYYGEKVGLYFAWLGFYTKMLILPAIFGIIVFFAGFSNLLTDEGINLICGNTTESERVICRGCPSAVLCKFHKLRFYCNNYRMNRVFDNVGATLFSIFMAVWAIFFLEYWKRYQAELCARWDVSDAELSDESVRPDYAIGVKTTKINPITQQEEPFMPERQKNQRVVISFITVITFMIIVIAFLSGIIIYKLAGKLWWTQVLSPNSDTNPDAKPVFDPDILTSMTASLMNGIFIGIMNKVYTWVAWKLTMAEMPRTQTELEESYTYKVSIFQFFNFYGALFYLAFIRGKFVGPPDAQGLFHARCPPTGCLIDVSIQLGIIMVGKQAINNFLEMALPLMKNWARANCCRKKLDEDNSYTRWEKDDDLEKPGPIILFDDYLEMLIQYGFVTMFVPAFPLAPLFALLNNIIEIRLDAYKTLTQCQRFIPTRAKDIGPWFDLLTSLSRVAVLTNACLIAFTTDFIDRQVYKHFYKDVDNEHGENYADFILSKFETKYWCSEADQAIINGNTNFTENTLVSLANDTITSILSNMSINEFINIPSNISTRCEKLRNGHDICYFRDYMQKSSRAHHHSEYIPSSVWWHVMVGKLVFILLFEHGILVIQALLRYCIPDVPEHITIRLQRESYLQKQAFMKGELGDNAGGVDELSDINSEPESDNFADLESFAESLPPEVSFYSDSDNNFGPSEDGSKTT